MKRIRAAVLVPFCLLMLCSCDVLFNGVFSSDVGQATARIDLSASIPAADAFAFALDVVEGFGREFVVLHSSTQFDTTLPHVYVFNPTLTLKDTYTLDFLTNGPTVPPAGTSVSGDFAMRDPSDHIIVGNVEYFPQINDLVPFGKLNAPLVLMGFSITGEPFVSDPMINFQIDPSNILSYQDWLPDWSAQNGTTRTAAVRPLTEGSPLWLRGVFTDPADINVDRAVLVFSESSSQTTWFLTVPKVDLDAGVFVQPLFDTPSYARFSKDNLDSNLFFFTRQGMIAYDQSSRSFIRFTLDSPGTISSMRVLHLKQTMRMSFSLSGNYYCTWDPDTRILTRYERWW